MNFTFKYFGEKYKNQLTQLRNEARKEAILASCGLLIQSYAPSTYIEEKEELERKICNDSRWEITPTGFESRTDFRYDNVEKEIVFTSNRIIINNGTIETNGTQVANSYAKENEYSLGLLLYANSKIEGYDKALRDEYLYKKALFDYLSLKEKDKAFDENRIIEDILFDMLHTDIFIQDYGEFGLRLIIEWLNRLNSEKSIEELVEEFKTDMLNAKDYYESQQNENYTKDLNNGTSFDLQVLAIMERYSPRGSVFAKAYKQSLVPKPAL